jgi:undecaprenyl-diphosphatase
MMMSSRILRLWSLLLILLICFLFVSSAYASKISDLDHDLFSYIHEDMNNKFLDKATPAIQLMGDPIGYWGTCLFLCSFGNEKMFETGKLASAGYLETGFIVLVLKETIRRPRPLSADEKTSFPSGHSAFAFTLATIMGHQYPKLRIPLYMTAIGTAFSRVYLGRHYPSDVFVGAVVGTLVGIQILHFGEPILRLSF